jgi:hypothetical protein
VLVKIANWPQSLRPAAGLNQADLVFEYYIGFQMNHLAAVFHGRDSERVGPLAPARMVDARLAEHYQGIVAYASADSTVEKIFAEVLPDRAFARGFAPCPAICTITDTTGENTFVDTAALRTHASEAIELIETIDLLGFTFDPRLSDWDADAETLSLQYADFSVMEWRFDSETDQYVLYQDFADQGSITIVKSSDRADGAASHLRMYWCCSLTILNTTRPCTTWTSARVTLINARSCCATASSSTAPGLLLTLSAR